MLLDCVGIFARGVTSWLLFTRGLSQKIHDVHPFVVECVDTSWDVTWVGGAVEDFDYVIVVGGSAGSVLAARLSEDPAVRGCHLPCFASCSASVTAYAVLGTCSQQCSTS